jgi:hypothetical protein
MWAETFARRLAAWNALRESAQPLPLATALESINQWWSQVAWRPYYLHWDDQPTWPDPWQLLSDDIYCDLAKGLGILYTISMLDHADIVDARLVLTDSGHNLVLVNQGKYILNWEVDIVVNNNLAINIIKQYNLSEVKKHYN